MGTDNHWTIHTAIFIIPITKALHTAMVHEHACSDNGVVSTHLSLERIPLFCVYTLISNNVEKGIVHIAPMTAMV